MLWTLIIIVVFVAALLLIGALYAAAAGKGRPTSDSLPDDSADADEVDADGD